MPGSPDFVIRGQLLVDDDTAPGVGGAQQRLQRFERNAMGIGRRLMGMFAMLGGGAGVGVAVRGIVGLHGEIEQARIGMATLLSAQTGSPMTNALKTARGLVQGLNADAAKGVGGLSDYTSALQMMMGPGLSGGATLEQLRELTRTSLAAGFAMRGNAGLQQAPMDIVQALTSGVSDRQTPIAIAALNALGVTSGQFGALSTGKRIETLTKAFGLFGDGVEEMGKTWSAQMETFRDTTRRVVRMVTAPIYDQWKTGLMDVNSWLDAHEDTIARITTTWGGKLLTLWDHLVERAGTYAALVAASAIAPSIPGVSAFLKTSGSRMRRAVGGVGAALRDPLGMGRTVGGALGEFGGKAEGTAGIAGMGSVLGEMGSSLASLAGPFAIAATAMLAMKGALGEYPGVAAWMVAQTGPLVASIGRLGDSFAQLTGQSSALNMGGSALFGVLGGVGWLLDKAVIGFDNLFTVLGAALRLIGVGLKMMWALVTGNLGKAKSLGAQRDDIILGAGARLMQNMGFEDHRGQHGVFGEQRLIKNLAYNRGDGRGPGPWAAGDNVPFALRPNEDLPKPPGNTTVINIAKIEIKPERLDDPAMVAKSFEQLTAKLSRNRLQARRIPSPATG